MNEQLFINAGLNKTQAVAYKALLEQGSLKPTKFASLSGESRPNAYKVLDQLVDLDLATKKEVSKKFVYFPTNPVNLEKFINEKRKNITVTEQEIKSQMPNLLSFFYTHSEQPGIRFFEGKDGILKMYEDQLRTQKDIYFLRSDQDKNLLGKTIYSVMEKRHKLGIKVFGIEPAEKDNILFSTENDKRLGRRITFLPKGTYSEPVNIYVYGSKTALISFGEETIGTIIESPQISAAMKQIFDLLRKKESLS